jgi:DNA replication protein DnaC
MKMMNPSTIEQLKALRLAGMLEAWQQQQTSSSYGDLSFDERLALLVEHEHLRRSQQQLTTTASLNDIDFTVARGLSKSKLLELAQGQWLNQHLQLVIVGPTGVGKTFLASVLADAVCQQGQTVRYFTKRRPVVGIETGQSRWLFSQVEATISHVQSADSR